MWRRQRGSNPRVRVANPADCPLSYGANKMGLVFSGHPPAVFHLMQVPAWPDRVCFSGRFAWESSPVRRVCNPSSALRCEPESSSGRIRTCNLVVNGHLLDPSSCAGIEPCSGVDPASLRYKGSVFSGRQGFCLVPAQRFELRFIGPEPIVLPLNEAGVVRARSVDLR